MDRPHYLEFITHFDESNLAVLERFDVAFDKGARAALRGESLTTCPHGLPEYEPQDDLVGWRQADLVMEEPERSGWLLGWWAGYEFYDPFEPQVLWEKLYGAGRMAALLWYGLWRTLRVLADKDDDVVDEDTLAEALGCSVDEVRSKAEAEGWPYLHKPKKPGQPVLTVYPTPTRDTEKPS